MAVLSSVQRRDLWIEIGKPYKVKAGRTLIEDFPLNAMRERIVYRHVVRTRDMSRFTEGDCHILALELQRTCGWDLAAFLWHGKPDAHCFNVVKHPSGDWLAVDIEGPRPIDEFCKHWSIPRNRWGRFTRETIIEGGWNLKPQITKHSLRRARELAPIVVAETRATMKP